MNDIASQLRHFIRENFLFGRQLTFGDRDSFLEAGVIDSTGVLELVAFLEERFQITVEDDDLVPENLDSIDSVVRFVNRKTAAAPVP
jgi:acyl carrier protein